MNDRDLLIVLGNQLFPINYIKNTRSKHIFMAEDYHLCTDHKHHKLKILFFFLAMREYRKNLKVEAGGKCMIYNDFIKNCSAKKSAL